jgi:putative ABC transport system permease protein
MRFDIDTYQEILDTITRNKSRSLLTGFGVFWGVFMLVALIGGGNGLRELLKSNFAGFATNSTIVWSHPTTKAYKGFPKGRSWYMDDHDVQRLREQIPQLEVISPVTFHNQSFAIVGQKKRSTMLYGVLPDYQKIMEPKLKYGRYLNEMDIRLRRKVCVIGKKIYADLFADGINPVGQTVRIDSMYYTVVGVDIRVNNGVNFGGEPGTTILVPITQMRATYNMGNQVHLIAVTGRPGVKMSDVTDKIRQVVTRAHQVDPTDKEGLLVFNTELIFQIVDNLFKGLNIIIWIVGMGTLFAGAIGVSNIMMVTVRERTIEIGIRRAIGATPKMILSQIMMESFLLTLVAGMSGILFAVSVLQMGEMANTTDGIVGAHFQINFWLAVFAAVVIGIFGMLAGLPPALRAMNIKPVDAMRDE